MEANIEGVRTYVVFKVIEILDKKSPYLTLLEIYLDFDNHVTLNLK